MVKDYLNNNIWPNRRCSLKWVFNSSSSSKFTLRTSSNRFTLVAIKQLGLPSILRVQAVELGSNLAHRCLVDRNKPTVLLSDLDRENPRTQDSSSQNTEQRMNDN
jgi:hypothetical protein